MKTDTRVAAATSARTPWVVATEAVARRLPSSSVLGGTLLIAFAAAAMVWANSSLSQSYAALWQTSATIGVGSAALTKPLILWINDGLMAIFFLHVGLEIKGEVLDGALSSARKAALPVIAALGGMAAPAAVYLAFNAGTDAIAGWAIPAATDIAFVLGILALLGSRVPTSLKVFVTALAVVDDMGAVMIIAFFYSGSLAWGALLLAGISAALLVKLNRLGYRGNLLYVVLGAVLWVAVLKSGVHATIAGIVLALTIPRDMLHRWEGALHPWVYFVVMPVFALANAGVVLDSAALGALDPMVVAGVALGLVVGKSVGVSALSWAAVKLKLAVKPDDMGWGQLIGAAWLAGIGFTMSLFIADLAFADGGPPLASAKVGLLGGSLFAGVVGAGLLAWLARSGAAAGAPAQDRTRLDASNPVGAKVVRTEPAP